MQSEVYINSRCLSAQNSYTKFTKSLLALLREILIYEALKIHEASINGRSGRKAAEKYI